MDTNSMGRCRMRWIMRVLRTRLVLLLILLFSVACSEATPTASPIPPSPTGKQLALTASYRFELLFGPVQSVMGAGMSMTDQGQPVNHHLEIHIYHIASGDAVIGANPAVRIENLTTGDVREFSSVRECVPPNDHGAGPHYGDNLYLADGNYRVTIIVDNESASFEVTL